MNPKAWSHSALDDFVNCPRAYYEKKVAKSVQEGQSPQMLYGLKVHKAFEDRLSDGLALPNDLEVHEEYMRTLEDMPGRGYTERKIALDVDCKPCTYFAKNCWVRGIIDYTKIHSPEEATIVDYKTGKEHTKFQQLALSAQYMFLENPEMQTVHVEYYWTKTRMTSKRDYTRDMMPKIWAMFTPNLKQYVEAFKSDTWQPRPSGLCKGWCPVHDCEFWEPKKP